MEQATSVSNATEIVQGKVSDWMQGFFLLVPNIVVALVILLLFLAIGWAVRHAVHRVFAAQDRQDLGSLLGGFAKWGIWGFGFLTTITILIPSVKPSDALATLGIGSVAIGFAFKDILQNWFAGLLLLIRQPFRRGDQIVVNDYEGTVEHIEARATLIRTYDGRRVVIPNSDVYTRSTIVNTAFSRRRSEYLVGIGYGDDIEKAEGILLEAVRAVDGVEREPAPDVVPWELDGSSVNLKVRWWTDSQRGSVVRTHGNVIRAVKRALTEAGIDLPFPTRVVLFHDQTEDTDGNRAKQREGWPARPGGNPPSARTADRAESERSFRPRREAQAAGED